MCKAFRVVLTLSLLLGLAVTASAQPWMSLAQEVAGRSLRLPGATLSATLMVPETLWCYLRSVSATDEEATRNFKARWPAERGRGLVIRVYVSTKSGPLSIDWRKARLSVNGGGPSAPASHDVTATVTPANPGSGELVFPFDWQAGRPPQSVTLLLPPSLQSPDSPSCSWELPLPFPAEVAAAVAAVAGLSPDHSSPVRLLTGNTPLLTEVGGVSQGELTRGTEVELLEENGEWARVSVTGWVPKASLTLPGEEPALHPVGAASPESEDGGFRFRKVVFRPGYGLTRVLGEARNLTPNAYTMATFTVTVYDASGKIAAVGHVFLSNVGPYETKTFEAVINLEIPADARYKIQFDDAF